MVQDLTLSPLPTAFDEVSRSSLTSSVARRGDFRGIRNAFASRNTRILNSQVTYNWSLPSGVDIEAVEVFLTFDQSPRGDSEPTDGYYFTSRPLRSFAPTRDTAVREDQGGSFRLPGTATSYTTENESFASVAYIRLVDTAGNISDIVQVDDPGQARLTTVAGLNPGGGLYGEPLRQPFVHLPGGQVVGSTEALYFFTAHTYCQFSRGDIERYRSAAEAANLLAPTNSFSNLSGGGRRINVRDLSSARTAHSNEVCSGIPLPGGGQQQAQTEREPEPVAPVLRVPASEVPRGFYTNPEDEDNIVYIIQGPLGTFYCTSFEDESVIENVDGNGALQSFEGMRPFGRCPANLSNE